MNYYIFKTDNLTGKTIHICNGSHDTERECRIHWQAYLYGFMDGADEILGGPHFKMEKGTHGFSFRFVLEGKKDIEYFMLFDEEGQKLIYELCK